MGLGYRLPDPHPKEMIELAGMLEEHDVNGQILAVEKASSDVVSLGSGYTILDTPITSVNYESGLHVLDKDGALKEVKEAGSLTAEQNNICMRPSRINKKSRFHNCIFDKNTRIFRDLILKFENLIKVFESTSTMTDPPSYDNVREYELKEEFLFLDHCLSKWNIDKIIYDPNTVCLKKLSKIINWLSDVNDVLNKKKPSFYEGFNEIKIDKLTDEIWRQMTIDPSIIDGKIYEYYNNGETEANIIFPYFLFNKEANKCHIIKQIPEKEENLIIIRKMTALNDDCCINLLFEKSLSVCFNNLQDIRSIPIGIHNQIIGYYFMLVISVIALFISAIVIYLYCKKKVKSSSWYKIREIKRKQKRRRIRQVIRENEIPSDEMELPVFDSGRRRAPPISEQRIITVRGSRR